MKNRGCAALMAGILLLMTVTPILADEPGTGTENTAASELTQGAALNHDVPEEPLMAGEAYEDFLPVGSVVLLKDSTKKVMVMGYLQSMAAGDETYIYDYCGCLFPEGYMNADEVYLFDHEQIESIYYIGYQNPEQAEFLQRLHGVVEAM